jgi:hypothetical protein
MSWIRGGTADTVRAWFLCTCGRRVRHLYLLPGHSDFRPTCRICLKLCFLSQRSGRAAWFRRIVLPARRLRRLRSKLLLKKPTRRVLEQIRLVDDQITILMKRAERKGPSIRRSNTRRSYKNIYLALAHY